MLKPNNNVDILKYFKLITYLKQNGKGNTPNKAAIFTNTQIRDFLNNALVFFNLFSRQLKNIFFI